MPSDIKRARSERELLLHLDAAHNLACRLLESSDEAQDVTQEAFLRALKYFDSFRGENARAWLLKIVRNSCYSWIKNRPKLESMTEDDEGNLSPEQLSKRPGMAYLGRTRGLSNKPTGSC